MMKKQSDILHFAITIIKDGYLQINTDKQNQMKGIEIAWTRRIGCQHSHKDSLLMTAYIPIVSHLSFHVDAIAISQALIIWILNVDRWMFSNCSIIHQQSHSSIAIARSCPKFQFTFATHIDLILLSLFVSFMEYFLHVVSECAHQFPHGCHTHTIFNWSFCSTALIGVVWYIQSSRNGR